jgi:hypothetical protein
MRNLSYQTGLLAAALFSAAIGAAAQDVPARVTVTGQKNASSWFKAESQHFVVFSNTRNEDVTLLLDNLERLDYVLRIYTREFISGRSAPQKITLYYHGDSVGFDAATPGRPQEAVGLYSSCGAGVQGFGTHLDRIPSPGREQLAKQPLNNSLTYAFEAYARHFLYRYTDIRTPSSYIDGFAQYFSTLRFADNQMSIGRVPPSVARYIYFIDNGHSFQLKYQDILAAAEASDPKPAVRLEALAKSWLLTHYMLSSSDNQTRRDNYLNLAHQDIPASQALETAFGLKPSEVDNTMWRYRLQGIEVKQFEVRDLPSARISFTSLPDAVTDFLLADAALKSCPDQKAGKALLRAVSQHPGGIPNNDAARLTVSRAQIEWGNPEDALPYLNEALRKDDANFQATYLLGLAHLRLAEKDGAYLRTAASHLARARTLDPKSAEAAYAAYQVQMAGSGQPGQQALEAAVAAWHNAHEVNRYARVAALALAYLGRGAEADSALTLLAHNGRDPELAKWAQAWQQRLAASVTRPELLAEMRREPNPQAAFQEWTIAGENLMQTVEYNAGIEDTRKYLQTLRMANPVSEKTIFVEPSKK